VRRTFTRPPVDRGNMYGRVRPAVVERGGAAGERDQEPERRLRRIESDDDEALVGYGRCANRRCRLTWPGRGDGLVPVCAATSYCIACCTRQTWPGEHESCSCWESVGVDVEDDEDD
jgi:hypothetical protein